MNKVVLTTFAFLLSTMSYIASAEYAAKPSGEFECDNISVYLPDDIMINKITKHRDQWPYNKLYISKKNEFAKVQCLRDLGNGYSEAKIALNNIQKVPTATLYQGAPESCLNNICAGETIYWVGDDLGEVQAIQPSLIAQVQVLGVSAYNEYPFLVLFDNDNDKNAIEKKTKIRSKMKYTFSTKRMGRFKAGNKIEIKHPAVKSKLNAEVVGVNFSTQRVLIRYESESADARGVNFEIINELTLEQFNNEAI